MKQRVQAAVARVRLRFAAKWEAWETPAGLMWARVSQGWKGATVIEREPMTEDEGAVVDYVLREEMDQ